MQLITYKCLECGHYTISRWDGMRCAKCRGYIKPMGKATYVEELKKEKQTNKGLTVNVSLKDTKLFKRMIDVFLALMDNKHTPDWIKVKIENLVLNELRKDIEKCQL